MPGRGVAVPSPGDAALVLELYRHLGTDMLVRLRGMFALALWDEFRQCLLLARDCLGIKPLYLADDGHTLRAASQVKALLAGGAIDTAADPAGHAGFFLWGHVPEPHTLYRAIRPLPAGSWLWAQTDGMRVSGRFFDPGREMAMAAGRTAPGADVLRTSLQDSVGSHLAAAAAAAVLLGAGNAATLAAEVQGGSPRTLRVDFVGDGGEVPAAGNASRATRITAADFTADHQLILDDMDQPSIGGVGLWYAARAARQAGVRALLSGMGGDGLFAAHDNFTLIPRMVAVLAPFALVPAVGRLARRMMVPFASGKVAGALEYGGRWGGAYLLRRGLVMPWDLHRVLDPDMAREGWEKLAALAALKLATTGIGPARLKVAALEGAIHLNGMLRDADWAGMAHGVEIRTPLVDVDVLRVAWPQIAAAPVPMPAADDAEAGCLAPVARWRGDADLCGWARQVHQAFLNR